MKPSNLHTKIFLDSSDPQETATVISQLGFLDGQTTNPSLVAKNPQVHERVRYGHKFTNQEMLDLYKEVVTDISHQIPQGSVSIEVYADGESTAQELFAQGQEMFSWLPNAHIKYPTIPAGLEAASHAISAGQRVNMTLVFTQAQAAAVYSATRGAKRGQVFVSPFIGRLDDQGLNGLDIIGNILAMYDNDSHVEVLAASVRTFNHFLACLQMKADIITAPAKVLLEWADSNLFIPDQDWHLDTDALSPIAYQDIDLHQEWTTYNLTHELTDAGLKKFAQDWNGLLR